MKSEDKNMSDEILKLNAIELVKHHRKYCEGKSCNISLWLIARLLMNAGIKLSDEEKEYFF